ncbi:hypothetical protein HWV62_44305, partial [Athelia sp. TMB]
PLPMLMRSKGSESPPRHIQNALAASKSLASCHDVDACHMATGGPDTSSNKLARKDPTSTDEECEQGIQRYLAWREISMVSATFPPVSFPPQTHPPPASPLLVLLLLLAWTPADIPPGDLRPPRTSLISLRQDWA